MFAKLLPRNVHDIERGVRVLVGASLVAMVFVGPQIWWGWIGLVPMVTGLSGTCPLYTVFGFSTCPLKKA